MIYVVLVPVGGVHKLPGPQHFCAVAQDRARPHTCDLSSHCRHFPSRQILEIFGVSEVLPGQ